MLQCRRCWSIRMKQSWTYSATTKGLLSLWPLRFVNEETTNIHEHLQHLSSSGLHSQPGAALHTSCTRAEGRLRSSWGAAQSWSRPNHQEYWPGSRFWKGWSPALQMGICNFVLEPPKMCKRVVAHFYISPCFCFRLIFASNIQIMRSLNVHAHIHHSHKGIGYWCGEEERILHGIVD